jgi:putative transposase
MRATDGSGELAVATFGRMAMERMLAGLSTPRYPVGLGSADSYPWDQ